MDSDELNEKLEKLYKGAEAASAEGLADEAIRKCESALEILDIHFDEALNYSHSDFLMLGGNAYWINSNATMAQQFYRQAFEMEYGRMDAAVAMSVALFHLGAFTASKYHLEMVSVEHPDVAEVWYYRALLAVREGNKSLANVFFQKASDLESNRWLRPEFTKQRQVHDLVDSIRGELPQQYQTECKELKLLFRDIPGEELLHQIEPPLDPLTLILFEGTSRFEEDAFGVRDQSNHLTVFMTNIELIAGDPEKLRSEFEQVLLEEYARFLDIDVEKLADEESGGEMEGE